MRYLKPNQRTKDRRKNDLHWRTFMPAYDRRNNMGLRESDYSDNYDPKIATAYKLSGLIAIVFVIGWIMGTFAR